MEDIEINTRRRKFEYYMAWFVLIFFLPIGAWIVTLILSNIGKTTSADVESKKGVLNKTWQKFAFIYGSVIGYVLIFFFIIGIIIEIMF